MADKVVSVPRRAIGPQVGECDAQEIAAIDDALRRWLERG